MKNLTTVLIVLVVGYAGYYMYSQNKDSGLALGEVSLTDDMVARTQVFIERGALLGRVSIDTEIFENPIFRSYKSFTEPIIEQPIGRNNPFSDISLKKPQN